MFPWTQYTQGEVYIFHFDSPLGNLSNPRAQAQHYVGFAEDFPARMTAHASGHGAKITAAAAARGITSQVFHWAAPLAVEKLIKAHHQTSDYCPACAAAAGRAPKALPVSVVYIDQSPIPEVTPGRWDWQEGKTTQAWRASRVPAARDLAAIDDLI